MTKAPVEDAGVEELPIVAVIMDEEEGVAGEVEDLALLEMGYEGEEEEEVDIYPWIS